MSINLIVCFCVGPPRIERTVQLRRTLIDQTIDKRRRSQVIIELRIYHCLPTRLPALNERFTRTTLGYFRKYGIEPLGFWTTLVGPTNHSLTYMLKWDSLAERETRWNAFASDPEWIAARNATETPSPIVERVEGAIPHADSLFATALMEIVMQRIGFIGLGMMGTPMAHCVAKGGFELYVADADAAKLAALAGTAKPLTPDNAASLDALITMLPNSAIVEDSLLGTAAWARRLPRGAAVLDMSSSEPERSRRLGATLAGLGLEYLDAPVSRRRRQGESRHARDPGRRRRGGAHALRRAAEDDGQRAAHRRRRHRPCGQGAEQLRIGGRPGGDRRGIAGR